MDFLIELLGEIFSGIFEAAVEPHKWSKRKRLIVSSVVMLLLTLLSVIMLILHFHDSEVRPFLIGAVIACCLLWAGSVFFILRK